MKKLLLLSFIALAFMGCSSDDDMPTPPENAIIGTWKLFKSFENGVEDLLDACEIETTLEFSSNNNFILQNYEEEMGSCVLEETGVGTWSNTSGNVYRLTINGATHSKEMNFEDNTFFFETTLTVLNNGMTDTYKVVYKKI